MAPKGREAGYVVPDNDSDSDYDERLGEDSETRKKSKGKGKERSGKKDGSNGKTNDVWMNSFTSLFEFIETILPGFRDTHGKQHILGRGMQCKKMKAAAFKEPLKISLQEGEGVGRRLPLLPLALPYRSTGYSLPLVLFGEQ